MKITDTTNLKSIRKKDLTLVNLLPIILIIAALIGGLASFALTYDKIQVLKDASYNPSCNINPILSCGSVMQTEQASLLGIPNTIYGLVAFSMLLTFGSLLLTGSKVSKHIWWCAQAVATIGVIFMHYLFFQGIFRINAICPWCFATWMITIPIFWYITIYNLQQRNIVLPKRIAAAGSYIVKHHGDFLILWYLVIFGILLQHFWYYWSTLL